MFLTKLHQLIELFRTIGQTIRIVRITKTDHLCLIGYVFFDMRKIHLPVLYIKRYRDRDRCGTCFLTGFPEQEITWIKDDHLVAWFQERFSDYRHTSGS